MNRRLQPRGVAARAAAVLAAAAVGCGQGEPAVDLSRFPHVLELAPRFDPDQVRTESRLIDFGTPDAHPFQLDGWSGGDQVFAGDGSTFTWSLGAGSSVAFEILDPRRLAMTARLRPYRIDGPAQMVAFELNGRPSGGLTLKGGMRTYRFELSAAAVERGRNVLELRNVYPENIGPGPPDLGPPGAAWDFLAIGGGRPIAAPEVRGEFLSLPLGSEVRFYAELADAAVLTLEGLESSGRRGRLAVRRRADGDSAESTIGELRASPGPAAVDVGVAAPGLIELTLTAAGGDDSKSGEVLRLHRPRLRSASEIDAAPLDAVAAEPSGAWVEAGGGADSRRPNVLVYLVDTLRADHLGCYGYPKGTSPEIDAFAAESVLFENAYAQSSWTRSSVASLFTGRLPTSHGVRRRDDALSEDAATLAEILREAGYATAAFVTNRSASARFGLGQGFETFEYMPPDLTAEARHPLSDEVYRAAVDWLGEPRQRPFFLYLHTIDPHAPYAPPPKLAPELRRPALEAPAMAELEALRESFGSRRFAGPIVPGSLTWLDALRRELFTAEPAMIEDLVELYDAEIFFNDLHFGRLVDHLEMTGLLDETVIVFVSDHGEEFFDHRGWQHGRTLYEEQLRVPLIIRFPGGPGGVRVDRRAQHIDLLPTLADVLGVALPAGVQGRSLRPDVRGLGSGAEAGARSGEPALGAVYSHLELDGHSIESIVKGRYKLHCAYSPTTSCELYDLVDDPRERHDLAPGRPVLVRYLRTWLRALRGGDGGLEAVEADVDAEVREQLRALGYL